MNPIVKILADYLEKNPQIRFTQALFNLDINEFADPKNPEKLNHLHRDNYNDTDEKVMNRIQKHFLNS